MGMVQAVTDGGQRSLIEQQLRRLSTPMPAHLQNAYLAYQLEHNRHFLLVINLLGQLAYFSYLLADALLVPDVLVASFWVRLGLVVLTLPAVFWAFRHWRNVAALDLVLPVLVCVAAALWFELLLRSRSPAVGTYQYAAVIFIVLGNLCVRVRFWPALAVSLAISFVILYGVYRLSRGDTQAVVVFVLVYAPVLAFSLFISWSNTVAGRRAFLRFVLDDMTRQALADARAQQQALAETDALTSIGNRRLFDQEAHRYWMDFIQYGHGFGLLLVDIDHFKRYNDHYGHVLGDRCLTEVAEVLACSMRDGEFFAARYGGEEFAILVACDDMGVLRQIADRLVAQVRGLAIAHANRPDDCAVVTVSVGGVVTTAVVQESWAQLLARADALLYRAKHEGRDRACLDAAA